MSSPTNTSGKVLRVGIIGCGEVSLVIHIPNLNAMADWYQITYLCDVSKQALAYAASRVLSSTPVRTTADAYHVPHALLALKHNKYCLLEKPAALCFRDIDNLIAAEETSQGRVFVGTMRRYALTLEAAIKEVGRMEQIKYARVRDNIGPNAMGVAQ